MSSKSRSSDELHPEPKVSAQLDGSGEKTGAFRPGAPTTGVSFRQLSAYGLGSRIDYQKTFFNYPLMYLELAAEYLSSSPRQRVQIIHQADGVLESGETLAVLGRPGSGCSTLLKTLAGQTYGYHVGSESSINYQGLLCQVLV